MAGPAGGYAFTLPGRRLRDARVASRGQGKTQTCGFLKSERLSDLPPWLDAEFGMSDRTARNFMYVAENLGDKLELNSNLELSQTASRRRWVWKFPHPPMCVGWSPVRHSPISLQPLTAGFRSGGGGRPKAGAGIPAPSIEEAATLLNINKSTVSDTKTVLRGISL